MRLCGFDAGPEHPFFLIAGTCVVESEQLAIDTAGSLKEICGRLDIPFIYKSSFDKANRSSGESFRGPGMEEGLRILGEVGSQLDLPVLTDVHEDTPMDEVASVVDVLQTPAFLCRQTNFILRTAAQGLPVNIKKGQFLAPLDMKNAVMDDFEFLAEDRPGFWEVRGYSNTAEPWFNDRYGAPPGAGEQRS